MKIIPVACFLSAGILLSLPATVDAKTKDGGARGAGRYACTAGQHALVMDFSGKSVTLDGKTDAFTRGAATWSGKPGGVPVVVAPSEKGSIFDVSINAGRDYSGFLVCKPA